MYSNPPHLRDVVPRLNFGQLVVSFKNEEEHSKYIKHEYMCTRVTYAAYAAEMDPKQRAVLKNKLDKLRYDVYLAWAKGRQTNESTPA